MEAQINLRPAAPADIESILQVQRQSPGAAPWSAADYAGLLAAEGTLGLMAADEVRKRPAGFLLARAAADELEILNLAVAPAYRRQEIGRRLVEQALARAQAAGATRCWLEVRGSNQAALEFYRALGFVAERRRRGYYREPAEDAVVCVRLLAGGAFRATLHGGPAP